MNGILKIAGGRWMKQNEGGFEWRRNVDDTPSNDTELARSGLVGRFRSFIGQLAHLQF